MSRIGKQPIIIPEGVEVIINGRDITVKGPKGQLERVIDADIQVKQEENQILVDKKSNSKTSKQKWGLYRSLINNMVIGVTDGFKESVKYQWSWL